MYKAMSNEDLKLRGFTLAEERQLAKKIAKYSLSGKKVRNMTEEQKYHFWKESGLLIRGLEKAFRTKQVTNQQYRLLREMGFYVDLPQGVGGLTRALAGK